MARRQRRPRRRAAPPGGRPGLARWQDRGRTARADRHLPAQALPGAVREAALRGARRQPDAGARGAGAARDPATRRHLPAARHHRRAAADAGPRARASSCASRSRSGWCAGRRRCPTAARWCGCLRTEVALQETFAQSGDGDRFFASDEDFHRLIATHAGLPGIWSEIEQSKVHMDRCRHLTLATVETDVRIIATQHNVIIDADRARRRRSRGRRHPQRTCAASSISSARSARSTRNTSNPAPAWNRPMPPETAPCPRPPSSRAHSMIGDAANLRDQIRDIMDFYDPRVIDTGLGGYFQGLRDDGSIYDRATRHLVGTCRYIYNYATSAALLDRAGYLDRAAHGLDFLRGLPPPARRRLRLGAAGPRGRRPDPARLRPRLRAARRRRRRPRRRRRRRAR